MDIKILVFGFFGIPNHYERMTGETKSGYHYRDTGIDSIYVLGKILPS